MQYVYTTKPDDSCHEVSEGVYGRPAHTYEIPKLLKAGWTLSPEKSEGQMLHERAIKMYVNRFGKKPRKNATTESILKALEDSENEKAEAGESDSDVDGSEHETVSG